MTEAATTEIERNIVQYAKYVGIRVFDYRRWGILMRKYRRSGVWSIPVMQLEGPMTPLFAATRLANQLSVQVSGKPGDRTVVAARTLIEYTTYMPMQSSETDFTQWDMIVYDLELKGDVLARLTPRLRDLFTETRFWPMKGLIDLKGKACFNEITYQLLRASEKHTCLQ